MKQIKECELDEDDRMVSFDVVSLFTRVSVNEAIEVVSSRLAEDNSLEERTTLSPESICQLARLCLQSTYFQFRGSFYEQLEGAAMGSPLSLVIANLYMERFEERALDTAILRPKTWVRYVDDTFVIWLHGPAELKKFQEHFNSQRPIDSIHTRRRIQRKHPLSGHACGEKGLQSNNVSLQKTD